MQTQYSGEIYEHILVRAMLGNELAQRGLINVIPDVKNKIHIPRLKSSNVLQKHDPQPDKNNKSKGDVTYTERTLEPQDVMGYTEFNPRAFEALWRQYQPTGNLVFSELPLDIMKTVSDIILAQTSTEMGGYLINGVKDAALDNGFFDGFVARITSATNSVKVETTETTMVGRLKALYASIPKPMLRNPNLRILMSATDWLRYDDELTALHHKGADPTTLNIKKYKGVRIEDLAQWPEGLVVATICGQGLDSNLWVACALESDAETLDVNKVSNAGELYFMKLLMKVDTNIAFEEELVVLDKRGEIAEDKQFVSATPETMSFGAEGGDLYAVVRTSGSYSIGGTHAGFTTTRIEGGLKVTAAKNETGADRSGTIELKLNGSEKKAVIELFQGNGK